MLLWSSVSQIISLFSLSIEGSCERAWGGEERRKGGELKEGRRRKKKEGSIEKGGVGRAGIFSFASPALRSVMVMRARSEQDATVIETYLERKQS